MSVKFTDDIGQTEGAVDEGRPCRELLQLLIAHLTDSSRVFEGPQCSKQLNFSHTFAVCQHKYDLMAISVSV